MDLQSFLRAPSFATLLERSFPPRGVVRLRPNFKIRFRFHARRSYLSRLLTESLCTSQKVFQAEKERGAAKRSPLGISDDAQVLDRLTSLGMLSPSFLSTSCHVPLK